MCVRVCECAWVSVKSGERRPKPKVAEQKNLPNIFPIISIIIYQLEFKFWLSQAADDAAPLGSYFK